MRRKLERMILAKQRRDWDVARDNGALDPRRLTQAALGNRNVFRVKQDRAEIDTAVCVLIDLSGSMSGYKAVLAQQVAIALAQCLNTVGADFAVYGFGNQKGKGLGNPSEEYAPGGGRWGRYEPLDMYVFKEFGESLREAQPSLGVIERCIGGNNSDADAILEAWHKLKARPARRHVLITLSDGCPAWYTPFSARELTKRAVQRVIREGCECAGVGIMDNSVAEFYPVWTVANDLAEFAGKAMDILARMMLGERVRVSAA